MKTAIDELRDKIDDMLTSRDAFTKSVNKDALKDYINSLLVRHRNLNTLMRGLLTDEVTKALSTTINKERANKKLNGIQCYIEYRSLLRMDATTVENKVPLLSLANTVAAFVVILEELYDKIDSIFVGKEINLFNSRLSHVLVIGILVEANLLCNYTQYMMTAILSDMGTPRPQAKYRYAFLEEKAQDVATIVTRTSMKTGAYNFEALINDMKTKAVDVSLLDDMNNIIVNNVNSSKVSLGAKSLINKGSFALDFFRWIGEKWEMFRHDRMMRIQTEKEWMEAHIALLRLDLDGMNHDSSEYQRLEKIIQRYEDMINAADKKIQKYEQKFV